MPFYVCSLPNIKKAGRIPELITDDPAAIQAFAKKWDVPGRGVFMCIGRLKPGATRRCRENIGAIDTISADIDFKDLIETAGDIEQRLRALPLQLTWARRSGGGFHVGYQLKEPAEAGDTDYFERAAAALKELATRLSGDPAPAHPAALLRLEGTHNSKRGEPVLVEQVWGSGEAVDLTEVEALIELLPEAGLFTRKPTPAGNGHDHAEGEPRAAGEPRTAGEPKAAAPPRLEDIAFGNIHNTWKYFIGSELRNGAPADDVFHRLLQAAEQSPACQADPARKLWPRSLGDLMTWYLRTEPDFVLNLATEAQDRWHSLIRNKEKPMLVWRPDLGEFGQLQVRRIRGQTRTDDSSSAAANDEPHADKKKEAPPGKPPRVILRPFEPFDVATLPPRSWLYSKHYQRRTVSLTAGPGGMGKSSLDLVETVAMATGRNLLGEQPEQRLRVWYHNGEDPLEEIKRRIAAICQHYAIPLAELAGFLFITSGNEFPLRVAKGYANLEIDTELLAQISACISDREIDVAVFDPLVTLHSVSEIDTGKMDTVIRLFAGIADDNDAAIELAHHVRKPAAGSNADYDVHDIRGVTAITDAVRAARLLNRMNEKDAEAAGCDERERLSRFRVDRAKGNYSPPQAATWRQFINIELPNGDDVGVVTRWNFPGQGERTPERAAADQTAEQVFLLLLDKFIARGQNVSANPGPNYAPSKFAEEQEAHKAKVAKAALKAAMSRLLDAGRIRPEATGRTDRSSYRLIPWHSTPQ